MTSPFRWLGPDVLERFRFGQDTLTIANILGVHEHVIARLLGGALDLEYAEAQGRSDAWNASLEPLEQRHDDDS